MLYLEILEPPVSACALADQIGSTYQTASTNGLSKRVPLLTLEELLLATELELGLLEEVVATEELELDFTLEEVVATELEVVATELEVFALDEEVLTTELDDTAQPATTP